MRSHLSGKLHYRESVAPPKQYRKLYGDRSLISDIDIVNELDGHSGCVNALSWSKSGYLLASGSDDQHLNIHSYQPHDSTNQFRLATTVATGHTQNIFSVKFMPHHNDRTVITAAGDGEVRIFDLEYAGQAREASVASSMATEGRRRGRNTVYNGVRYLNDGNTDSRVYLSHGDRVKRIVTESSPHLFLTCSEDGEVRQWDLRQPSSAYPAPRAGRYGANRESSVPPPLISYKRYNLDLNTISCSASQPHYIALGGAHLHAFLHDRRMTGRDRLREAGKTLSSTPNMSAEEEDLMSQATQCVRKFAPKGQRKMKRTENGHITACKISDARPDEMIVSWSGDHIYSFDLIRSPDAVDDEQLGPLASTSGTKVKKRKRKQNGSEASLGQDANARTSSRPRTEGDAGPGASTAIRVRYQNGQTEDITLPTQSEAGSQPLTARAREAARFAKSIDSIRTELFTAKEGQQGQINSLAHFSKALGRAASILSDIDEAMREWRYPMQPTPLQVHHQQKLRRNRESARRFVQGAGTLARVLGGSLQTPSGSSPLLAHFTSIEARSIDAQTTRKEQFGYDFLKAILLWLESGIGRLVEGFTRPSEMSPTTKAAQRLPIPESEASTEAVDDILIPYLLRLASDGPVLDSGTNQFEHDENRVLVASEQAAVLAFAAAVKIPFADLSSAVVLAEEGGHIQLQDREAATRYWGLKLARGVLLCAATSVDFSTVYEAFSGSQSVADEDVMEVSGDDEDERAIQNVEFTNAENEALDGANAEDLAKVIRELRQAESETSGFEIDEEYHESDALLRDQTVHDDGGTATIDDDDEGDDDDDDDGDQEEDDNSSETDDEDEMPDAGLPSLMYTSAFERRRMREKVESSVPCAGPTRTYRGHCNVRTVKDVNYFGLDDEYVVSGSDDGHFFMWDRKTSELVGLWEGDGEVVNVVQGHPYETMLAVSGIDHTVKIFSPDARAREAARLGNGVSAHDPSDFSSISWPLRLGRRTVRRASDIRASELAGVTTDPDALAATEQEAREAERAFADESDGDYVSPSGLASRQRMHDSYRIMTQNDVERQGGNQDAYITRSMLAQLAARIRARRAAARDAAEDGQDDRNEEDDEPTRIDIDDDCVVQ